MPEEKDTSAETLARALELELAQKRLHWQRDREKYRTLRVLSFGFLFIIILAGLIALFFFFSHTNARCILAGTQTHKFVPEFYSAAVLMERTAGKIPAGRTGHRLAFHSRTAATAGNTIRQYVREKFSTELNQRSSGFQLSVNRPAVD